MQTLVRSFALVISALALVTAGLACGGGGDIGFGGGGGAVSCGEIADAGSHLCGPSLACETASEYCVDLSPESAMSDAGAVAHACRALPEKCCGKASCACIGAMTECPDGRTPECKETPEGTILVECKSS